MLSWLTENGYKITRLLKGRSNIYLISGAGMNLMVDAGHARNYARLRQRIHALEPERRRIDMLILTHTHYDHCQNAARISKEYGCEIILGAEEKDAAASGYTTIPRGTSFPVSFIAWMGRQIGRRKFGYEAFEADRLVNGTLDLSDEGLNIRLISTPGHSAGSISMIVDHEIALVGDAMFGIFRHGVFPPFADDVKTMIESWGLLLDTRCRIFLPGHGKPIPRESLQAEYEKRNKERD